MTFGEAFKAIRQSNGITQMTIAKYMKYVNAQFISNWERGISYPSPSSLQKICKKYGFDYQWLMNFIVMDKNEKLLKRWALKQKKEKVNENTNKVE